MASRALAEGGGQGHTRGNAGYRHHQFNSTDIYCPATRLRRPGALALVCNLNNLSGKYPIPLCAAAAHGHPLRGRAADKDLNKGGGRGPSRERPRGVRRDCHDC